MANNTRSLPQDEHIFRSHYPPVQVPEVTLPDFVLQDAEFYSLNVAFVDAATGKTYTYGEVSRDVRRFARALRLLGARTGQVVVVVLPNIVEYAVIALGIMAAGGVFSCANPDSHASEIKKQVDIAEAKLIVTDAATHRKAYGMTEHSCITLSHGDPSKGHGIAKRNSVGFILPNLEVKFVDPDTGSSLPKNAPGEICVRSQCVMKGYYKNEYETAMTIDKDGWLHTGDVGYIDDDGDVFLVDRIKEIIKYKGYQVAPAEIEGVLLTHPSVEDAAVVG